MRICESWKYDVEFYNPEKNARETKELVINTDLALLEVLQMLEKLHAEDWDNFFGVEYLYFTGIKSTGSAILITELE